MKDGQPGSFTKFFKNEPMTASYLGFQTRGDFRRLRFHPITLYWYVAFDAYCSGGGAKTPMSIIQDKTDRSYFGRNLPGLLSLYPTTTEATDREQRRINIGNRDHFYAGMFYHTSVRKLCYIRTYIYAGILYQIATISRI